jgi:hypothetical protein
MKSINVLAHSNDVALPETMCSTRPLSRSSDTVSLLLHSMRNAPRGSKAETSAVGGRSRHELGIAVS